MGKHKKFKKNQKSRLEKWIEQDFQARQASQKNRSKKKRKKVWDPDKDIVCKWNVYDEPQIRLNKKNKKKERVVVQRIKRNIKIILDGKDRNGNSKTTQTWQRLKLSLYKEFLGNKRELENICFVLNGQDPGEARVGIKFNSQESCIPRSKVLKFCRLIQKEFVNDDKKDINCRLNNFIKCSFEWFQARDPNPNNWKKFERQWGRCLLNTDASIKDYERIFPENELRSKNTIIRIIWMTNKFMEYLHEIYPNRYPLYYFDPIRPSQFRSQTRLRKGHPD